MGNPHIVKSFDEQLDKLLSQVKELGQLSSALLRITLQALDKRDRQLAANVIDQSENLKSLNGEIFEQVIRLLALRAPVADDLRVVITGLKVATDLQNVGQYAINIAQRISEITDLPHKGSTTSVIIMGHAVTKLLDDVLQAYQDLDTEVAMEVWRHDQNVDEQYSSLFRALLTHMMENANQITIASHLLFIAKNLERIGDHATNIAEKIYYQVTSTSLTDARPKGSASEIAV